MKRMTIRSSSDDPLNKTIQSQYAQKKLQSSKVQTRIILGKIRRVFRASAFIAPIKSSSI